MAKRSPITSPSEAVRIMQGASREIAPPSHIPLEEMDWPYWHNVVAEFARADWTEHQLELAAMIARTMANLEKEQRLLRDEGMVLARGKSGLAENPRVRITQILTSQILTFRRSLALHARGRGGNDVRVEGKRIDTAKRMEADSRESLFATP